MTTTQAPTFRRTKSGEWVAFGPADRVRPGRVEITKRDGSSKVVTVVRTGRPFTVDGVTCAYGYLDDSGSARRPGRSHEPVCRCGDAYIDEGDGECMICGGFPR